MNVPVEIFFEILSHLQPIDLLQLSRVSLELRQMLLSRRMKWLWVASLKRLEPAPPECPEDFPEPAFVSLVFEKSCMACGAGRAHHKVCYANRIRFCGSCWKENVKLGMRLVKDLGDRKETDIFYLVPEVAQYLPRSGNVLEDFHQHGHDKYYEPEFQMVWQELLDHRRSCPASSLNLWMSQRKTDTLRRLNFHRAMGKWEFDYQEGKHQAQQTSPVLPFSTQSAPTTVWKTIRPELVDLIVFTKIILRKFLQADRELHPWKRTLPSVLDAFRLPAVRTLITSAEPNVALTVEECEAEIADKMVEHARPYTEKIQGDLARLWRVLCKDDEDEPPVATARGKNKDGRKGSRGKGKGKEIMVVEPEPGEVIDPAADLALLQRPTALFMCRSPLDCDQTAFPDWMTYVGVLEHMQTCHRGVWNDMEGSCLRESVLPAHSPIPDDMRSVLKALKLPADTDVLQLEDVLIGMEGFQIRCNCVFPLLMLDTPGINLLARLLHHVGLVRAGAEKVDPSIRKIFQKHRFTKVGPKVETKVADTDETLESSVV
ncbi:uncharacterized protein BXZ73DRAFT_103660 [Epithele typhae]|uniref:uncharacterized protein n=1 Tax=Epithele typhae TaxID=378194 RepID=UPI0020077EA9|nr:uncharacterized protein BXZ73DRAFT_103660 [Epithele typhae]KAH9923926.1 hypothetical protein BXZ73DRAFT_103660 [Epithele typhae]